MEVQKKESKKKAVDTSKSDGDDYDLLSKRTQTKSMERKCEECTEEKKGSILEIKLQFLMCYGKKAQDRSCPSQMRSKTPFPA